MSDKTALYERIKHDIRQQIFSGRLRSGDKLPGELELCSQYRVSRITAKRAMDDLSTDGLIRRVKGSGSYVERFPRVGQFLNEDRIFHFVIPFDVSIGRAVDMVAGANDFFQKNGCMLNILNSTRSTVREREILRELLAGRSCGVLYYPFSRFSNWDLIMAASARRFPMITVDKPTENDVLECVMSDSVSGAYEATSYFIRQGHRRIGFVSDMPDSIEDRFYGYCTALCDSDLALTDENYIIGYLNRLEREAPAAYEAQLGQDYFNPACIEALKPILASLLDRPEPVTAILGLNDYVATQIMKTALEMGVQIPSELSLIGFDNLEFTQHLGVPLTTMEQSFYEIGRNAAEILYSRIVDGRAPAARKTTIPMKLIERASVCPPKPDV